MAKKKKKNGQKPITPQNSAKICLNAIMKNESHVITRCLDNVGHMLDAVYIIDTGSTDNSIQLAEEWCKKKEIPFEISEDPWRGDFGYSRTLALRRGEKFILNLESKEEWYFMFMDIDNLAYDYEEKPFPLNKNLTADAYRVEMRSQTLVYDYIWIVKVNPEKRWQWFGPCHEFVGPVVTKEKPDHMFDYKSCKPNWEPVYSRLEGGYVDSRREGSRSNDDLKYLKDAISFETALLTDPMNDRHLYYIAQSYRDAGIMFREQAEKVKNNKQRHEQYLRRIAQCEKRAEEAFLLRAREPPFNIWNDEYTYLAWVEAGKMRLKRKGFDKKTFDYFMKGHQVRGHRLEAPYYLLYYYRLNGYFNIGWSLAKDLINLPYPKNDIILIDHAIHQYLFIFEASVCAYYAGAKNKFVELSKKVIENSFAAPNYKEIAKSNLEKYGKITNS